MIPRRVSATKRPPTLADVRKLFANGEQGGYWGPDYGVYEDSAGRYVSSSNGVIGLWLDRSKGDPVLRRNIVNYSSLTSPAPNYEGFFDFRANLTWSNNKISEKSDNWYREAYFIQNGAGSGIFTFSVDIKRAENSFTFIEFQNGSGFGHTLEVNLLSGAARFTQKNTAQYSETSYNVTALAEDWFRISITSRTTYSNLNMRISMGPTAYVSGPYGLPPPYAGTPGNGIYIRNAQLERGAVATEYQPITTNAAFAAENWANNVQAVQATTANKPYLRRTSTTNLWWVDANTATSALTATFGAALGAACTVARIGPEGVTWLENQTISTTYNIAPAYGWNGEVMMINRALTVAEKAIVTRYMARKRPIAGEIE